MGPQATLKEGRGSGCSLPQLEGEHPEPLLSMETKKLLIKVVTVETGVLFSEHRSELVSAPRARLQG